MAILNNSNAISTVGGYNLTNSLRFRASASAFLNRTPASATNRKTWTWSAWLKRGTLSSTDALFNCNGSATNTTYFLIRFESSGALYIGNASTNFCITTQVFRDPSAWYHIVINLDTTQATASDRLKIYVNGVQVTAFSSDNRAAQIALNSDQGINQAAAHNIGRENSGVFYLDGYLTEINFIDGQALTPSSFGETDTTTGVWKPKAYTSTYGTNGFYLKFSDIATTSGSNAGLGKDFSGNANYWTTNNISVTAGTTYDAMIDSPTLTSATVANYATFNPINVSQVSGFLYGTASSGNLDCTSSANYYITSTIATPTTGKYYFEYTQTSTITSGSLWVGVSINGLDNQTSGYAYASDARKINFNTATSYGATWTQNDVIGCALDLDNQTITFYKNNVSQGTAYTGITQNNYFFGISTGGAWSTKGGSINCGQRPFAYTPPTGFVRLNTYNLPDSTIKKGNTVMDATTYTGTGATQSITNAGAFKPDLVWTKGRSNAVDHGLFDSNRGSTKLLSSNLTAAELTYTNQVTGFNSNGFSLGADNLGYSNFSGVTYVAWQWQAGQGTNTSNTSGTITSTVSVNATAGFSVVTYTGTGTTGTVGHGLGVAPKMIIIKNRGIGTAGDGAWQVYHASIGNTQYLSLNTTAAAATSTARWNNTSPTSTVFTVATTGSVNDPSNTYVAYCWAEIAGFSRFGSYTGNGNADGPFIFTNFRPEFFLVKRTDTVESWNIVDTSRNEFNQAGANLYPNLSNAESTNNSCDILSNGIKLRNTWAGANASGGTYIYMAFAENPFKNANAR